VQHARSSARDAFTLVEVLVAVGAVAIITVGIAAVFQSVGRTVSSGKRLQRFNEYAGLLEAQLRRDVAAMDRSGFLVVRNEYIDPERTGGAGRGVQLWEEDGKPHPRRSDQLMFFALGDYVSARTALHPDLEVHASEARVYYGHGVRPPNNPSSGDPGYDEAFAPDMTDELFPWALANEPFGLGVVGSRDQYASNWALLRHVTLLAPWETSPRSLSGDADDALSDLGLSLAEARDSMVQVGGQPATPYLFRRFFSLGQLDAGRVPSDLNSAAYSVAKQARPGATPTTNSLLPTVASGMVDIASTDLPALRMMVMRSDMLPEEYDSESDIFDDFGTGPVEFARSVVGGQLGGNPLPREKMMAWIDQLMPTSMLPDGSSVIDLTTVRAAYPQLGTNPPFAHSQRIRFDDRPAGFLSSVTTGTPLQQAVRKADYAALASAVLVPNCSEFIVEYSFGKIDRGGQIIWHGLERRLDADGDGVRPGDTDSARVALPYPWYVDSSMGSIQDGQGAGANDARAPLSLRSINGTQRLQAPPLDAGSVYGYGFAWGTPQINERIRTAYFGFVDPSGLTPPAAPAVPINPDGGAVAGVVQHSTSYKPATWPTLLRVTVRLADPNDPSIEETYQFVLDLPGNPEI
jgi:type II secretory pathway pseudopilin PulG